MSQRQGDGAMQRPDFRLSPFIACTGKALWRGADPRPPPGAPSLRPVGHARRPDGPGGPVGPLPRRRSPDAVAPGDRDRAAAAARGRVRAAPGRRSPRLALRLSARTGARRDEADGRAPRAHPGRDRDRRGLGAADREPQNLPRDRTHPEARDRRTRGCRCRTATGRGVGPALDSPPGPAQKNAPVPQPGASVGAEPTRSKGR